MTEHIKMQAQPVKTAPKTLREGSKGDTGEVWKR